MKLERLCMSVNGEKFIDIIYGAIDKNKDAPQLIMATVGAIDYSTNPTGSKVFLKFDGSSTYSPYSYPIIESAFPLAIDQRVLVARISGSFLVVGKVKTYT